MTEQGSLIASLSHFLYERFLVLLLGAYALAAFCPAYGLCLRSIFFGDLSLFGERTKITLPMMMLMLLLLNAGLGVDTSQLRNLRRGLAALVTGLVVNLAAPMAFIFGVAFVLQSWHNTNDVQNLLVGLALITAMPVAGSSTAWSQNANGNVPLSLGLVIGSTFLSPITTPIALHSVASMTTGEHSRILHSLALNNTGTFLTVCVLVPSLVGIGIRAGVGKARMVRAKPSLKLINLLNLLVLNYSNASASLPQVVSERAIDLVGIFLGVVLVLCLVSFLSGWLVAFFLKTDRAQKASLMFGLGMNNNGTGLVLASVALADHPRVMLPILLYNLVQHLVAGGVDFVLCRGDRAIQDAMPGSAVSLQPHEVSQGQSRKAA